MATESEGKGETLSGLTENEAKEFHKIFMQSFIAFVGIAVIAHILAWLWRPWLPAEGGYQQQGSLLDAANQTVASAGEMVHQVLPLVG
jgi:light-harvesting complex 1 beta chain